MTKSEIFKKAWTIATIAEFNYGGNKKEYFAMSLKHVYKMTKTHSIIKTYNWNFGIIDSYLMITIPEGNSYKLHKAVLGNYYNTKSKFLYEAAKESFYAFTFKEIESIKYLSNRKF